MRLPDLDIQKHYFAALSGISVPVYDQVDVNETGPYVWIQDVISQTGAAETKFRRGFDVSVSLNIVTRFLGNAGGFAQAMQIASEITEIMCQKPYPQPSNDWQIITATLDGTNKQTIAAKDGTQFVINLRIFHEVSDKNQTN